MDDLKAKYLTQIADAVDESALEAIRLAAVGKKGEVALKMRELGRMTPEERQVAGPALNALKDEINSALLAKKSALGDAALDERLRSERDCGMIRPHPRGFQGEIQGLRVAASALALSEEFTSTL